MKKTLFSIFAVAVATITLLPAASYAAKSHFDTSAHCRHNCTPFVQKPPIVATSTPPVSTSAPNCINYGYQPLVGGLYAMPQVMTDLAYLKAHNYTCVRLAFYGTNSANTKTLATASKGFNFYVAIGNDGDPSGAGYAAGVLAEAAWAQANHIDQMSVGNEDAKTSATQALLANLSCAVKKVFAGTVSYDTYLDPAHDDIKAWAANRGCLDKLGLNIYASYSSTMAEAQSLLGSNGFYVSETDLDCDTGVCGDDQYWATNLSSVLKTEAAYHVPVFIFSYNAGGDGVATHWAIMGHPAVQAAIGL